MLRSYKFIAVLFFAFHIVTSICSGQIPGKIKENDLPAPDPSLRYGKLSNGFTYYLQHTGEFKNRIYMNLVVKAGDFQQDTDQVQCAHLIEHMAFLGT
ncbi:MAG TPA: hypothetical protein VHM26_18510, partial [Chitinophagaceae bacterium]|nr:hypothetical protein [Chitinophagaceae bacterium]